MAYKEKARHIQHKVDAEVSLLFHRIDGNLPANHPDNLDYRDDWTVGSPEEKLLKAAIYYHTGHHVDGRYPVRACVHAHSNILHEGELVNLVWVAPRDMPLGPYKEFTISVDIKYYPTPNLVGISSLELPVDYDAKRRIFEKKIEKAFQNIVNIPVAVAELKDFARLYQTVLRTIATNASKLSKASDMLLSYEFCLKQIVRDIKQLMTIKERIRKRMQHLKRTEFTSEESASFPEKTVEAIEDVTPWPYVFVPYIGGAFEYQQRRLSRTRTLKFTARVTFDKRRYLKPYLGVMDAWSRSLGADNLLVAAWNLVPFSFLVDWVWKLPVDTLASAGTWTDRPKVADLATHVFVRDEYSRRLVVESGQGQKIMNLIPEESIAYRRWVGYPNDTTWSMPHVSAEWIATLAALWRSIRFGDTRQVMRDIAAAEQEVAELARYLNYKYGLVRIVKTLPIF